MKDPKISSFFRCQKWDHKHCVTQVNVQAEAVIGEVAIHRHTLGSSVATIFFGCGQLIVYICFISDLGF